MTDKELEMVMDKEPEMIINREQVTKSHQQITKELQTVLQKQPMKRRLCHLQ